MKKIISIIALVLCTLAVPAQSISESSFAKIVSQSPDANVNFRLYPTTNKWTFLKLDTRSGVITHVQYSLGGGNMEYPLNPNPLVDVNKQKPGRFYMYPTTNMYNFILLDQVSGKCWQVQWNMEEENRGVWRIMP